MFQGLETNKSVAETKMAENAIDVDADVSTVPELNLSQVKERKRMSEFLNIDLIKREIKREQKLDLERMKKEKQDLKELLQL